MSGTVKGDMITIREMKVLETNAEYFGISRLQLMENAGRGVAAEIAARYEQKKGKVAVFCGLGGNGGDGFAAARHLACYGFRVDVFLAGRARQVGSCEAQANLIALNALEQSVTVHEISDSSFIPEIKANVIVDALLGTGLAGKARPPILQLIRKINEMEAFCIAIDIPSGINADSGEVFGDAVEADLTIALHKAKQGLMKGKRHVGELIVIPLGIPSEVERLAGPGDVFLAVRPRRPYAHKGDFGRLLVIGGGETYSGAPALAALAAYRAGVDLAVVAAPRETAKAISSMSPDLITIKLEGERLNKGNASVIRRSLETANAVVIGPGLGLHSETQEAVSRIIVDVEEKKIPLLLDADGLKVVAKNKRRIIVPTVLTPHAGEYQILTGKQLPEGLDARVRSVHKTAQDLDAVVLLKSHVDIISDGYREKLNFTGNPGMTVGGTGDVLSGIVGGFLAQGVGPFEASVAGAFVNGAAGDFVRAEKGFHMVASDLLEWIPKIMDNPMCHLNLKKDS